MAKFRATESFTFTGANGKPRVIMKGALVDGRDPDYRGREHLFAAVDRPGQRGPAVEDATAEPGARRSLGRPRGRR